LAQSAESGPYAVARIRAMTTNPRTGHRLEIDVYYPGLDGGVDPRGSPYPALVFARGFLARPFMYAGNGRHLASWGYVVAIPDFPDENAELRAADVEHLISYLEAQNADEGSRFFRQIDASRFGLVGHSLGGLTTLMVAARDVRIKAAVALDPVRPPRVWWKGTWDYRAEGAGLTAPLAVIAGPPQRCNVFAGYRRVYAAVGSGHKAKYVLVNGSHCDYMDLPASSIYVQACVAACGRAFSEERAHLAEAYTAAWFNYYLKCDTDGYDQLFGPGLGADVREDRIVAEIATAPRDLKATTAGTEVHLTWSAYDIPLVAGYRIYRTETEGWFGVLPLASVGRLGAYVDADALAGHTYFYAVASCDPLGQEHGRAFAGPVMIPLQNCGSSAGLSLPGGGRAKPLSAWQGLGSLGTLWSMCVLHGRTETEENL
jgi:pimeloyl-ACP methyl ester carboxylesterase